MRVHQRRGRTGVALAVILRCVSPEIRDQRQVARALDSSGELALVPRARAAEATRKNLSLIGYEPSKRAIVLVIDPANAALAERTGVGGVRLGQPADVAPMVTLLASDAGSWITGQVISISGGFSMV